MKALMKAKPEEGIWLLNTIRSIRIAKYYNALLASVIVTACTSPDTSQNKEASAQEGRQSLMTVEEGRIQTTHSLRYEISAKDNFAVILPDNRSDIFNGAPFYISRSAFIRDDAAVMVHAETVADGSGASNYDNLPLANWPVDGFRSDGHICFELSKDDIEGEDDPEWLLTNGFDPTGVIMFAQYFLASPDYNDEIVISLMLHVNSCETDDFNVKAFEHLKSEINMAPTQ